MIATNEEEVESEYNGEEEEESFDGGNEVCVIHTNARGYSWRGFWVGVYACMRGRCIRGGKRHGAA